MSHVARLEALLEALSPEMLAGCSRTQREALAALLRGAADLADRLGGQPVPPRCGVLAQLQDGVSRHE